MNLDSTVSLGQLFLAVGVFLVTSGTAWGSLLQRVKTLEKQMDDLKEVPSRLTALETTAKNTEHMVERLVSRLLEEPRSFQQRDDR